MGLLWKELAARWFGGAGTTAGLPSRIWDETRMLRDGPPRTPALSGATNGPEDQPPEEALQPDATVRYPSRPRSRQARPRREALPVLHDQEIDL